MIDAIKVEQPKPYTIEEMPKRENVKEIDKQQIMPYTLFEMASEQEPLEVYGNDTQKNNLVKDEKNELVETLSKMTQKEWTALEEDLDLENTSVQKMVKGLKNIKKEEKVYDEKARIQYNKKIEKLKEHTDSMYTYAMQTQGELTINDLYKGSFTGTTTSSKKQYTTEEINSVLRMNGLEVNEGNAWATEKLLHLGIDVSEQSVVKIQNIHTAIDSLEGFEEAREEVEKIIEIIREDEALIEGEKVLYNKQTIEAIQEDLQQVDDKTIQEVIKEGQVPTIQNLREKLLKNTKQVTEKLKVDEDHTTSTQAEDYEHIKKQINEIRARLNTETAQRLSARMPLESSELAKVAEGLRQVEAQIQEEALVEADLPLTDENKELLQKVMDVTLQIGQYKEATVPIQIETQAEATLEAIHEVLNLYEQQFSEAEARFGESIQSVEGQIEHFLVSHDLPVNDLSIDAAKALITNGMDLTVENLEGAQSVLRQINTFLETLTPYEAAHLIKEGINPYKASIPTLLEAVDQSKGTKLKESIAKSIMTLEETKQINEEQRKSLIGLYKIVKAVLNNKEQVAGYLVKNGLSLTVEQLEEAVRYAGKQSAIEVGIDDTFGHLESLNYKSKSGRTLMYEADEKMKGLQEAVQKVQSLPLEQEGKSIETVATLKSMLMPFIKEVMKKEWGQFEGTKTLPQSLLEKIDGVKEVPQEVIQTMKDHKVPLTLNTIYWTDQFIKNPNLYKDLLKKTGLDQKIKEAELPLKKEALHEEVEQLKEELYEQKEKSMTQGDLLNYKQYKQLEEVLDLQKQLADKEGIYQIPYRIHGETKMVQFYIKEESNKKNLASEGLKGVMRYETKNLGTITTYFTIKGDQVGYNMHIESSEAQEALENAKAHLQAIFQQLGYGVSQEGYQVPKETKPPLITSILKGESAFEAII